MVKEIQKCTFAKSFKQYMNPSSTPRGLKNKKVAMAIKTDKKVVTLKEVF